MRFGRICDLARVRDKLLRAYVFIYYVMAVNYAPSLLASTGDHHQLQCIARGDPASPQYRALRGPRSQSSPQAVTAANICGGFSITLQSHDCWLHNGLCWASAPRNALQPLCVIFCVAFQHELQFLGAPMDRTSSDARTACLLRPSIL